MQSITITSKTKMKPVTITHTKKGESWEGFIVRPGNTSGVYFVEQVTDSFAEWLPLGLLRIDDRKLKPAK